MPYERVVVDVMNSIGPTSAPFNGFAAYRARHYPEERHVIVCWGRCEERLVAEALGPDADRVTILDGSGGTLRLAGRIRRLLGELRAAGVPVVVHLHHHRSGLLFQLVGRLGGSAPPSLFTVRNAFSEYSLPAKLVAAATFCSSAAVSFVGRASRHAFPGVLRRLRRSAVYTVPNGVDLERVDAALERAAVVEPRDAEREEGGLRLLYVARFVRQKHHAFLVHVLSGLPRGVRLTLVGDGPLRQPIAEWIGSLGLGPRVRFTGIIPREAVYEEMARADVFVSSALWEGLPVAVLEAMACRLPVLLSDIPAHREVADAVPSVRLLPLHAPEWRVALEAWAALPRAELRAIGDRNREGVVARLSLERMHAQYTEVYRRLALAPRGGG